eukprot:TRINITY_DN1014_c0_g1_i1.p1 TRINITY_DN1014_c0_g1~~TRINITY_DN1014_c0_g1_i1.p1  ORF type:complete len:202 (+),score=51.37 TRINITY_DN1014_c0_g1_i1:73-678(+)
MSAQQPVLTYFAIRGLAEVPRLLFHAAGAPFQDKRLTQEEFGALKESGKLPNGQVPILEVNGKVISQSAAIVRYIAREHNLYGSNNLEAAAIDAAWESQQDVRAAVRNAKTDEEKAKLRNELLPKAFGFIEKHLVENGSNGHFVGNKLSYADVSLYYYVWVLEKDGFQITQNHPAVQKVYQTVSAIPAIAEYLKNRPETNM